MIRRSALVLFVAATFALASGGCDEGDRTTLKVFADTSLTEAFEALAEEFEERNPGVDVEFTFGDSEALAEALRDGAADVVAFADQATMSELASEGLVGDAVELTTNHLVLVTREGFDGLESIEGLSSEGIRIAIADSGDAAGVYAREAIDRAAEEYGGAWQTAVLDNIAGEEENVRDVLERMKDGEADAGFVYLSDLTPLGHDVALGLLPLPARIALAPIYPAALTARPAEIVLAQAFLDFALSDEGQATIESFGFGASQ